MYVYLLSVILAFMVWKLVSLITNLIKIEKRLSEIEIIPENHWFWGFTNKVSIEIMVQKVELYPFNYAL